MLKFTNLPWIKKRQNRKHGQPESGFTLIELLVVTMMVGILSAVAIAAAFGQVQKAKEVEAINGVGSMNRRQQEQYQGSNDFGQFLPEIGFYMPETANPVASPLDTFGIDSQQTENFIYGTYSIEVDGKPLAINFAISKQSNMKSVVGAVLGEGNAVNTCGPEKFDVNLQSSPIQVGFLVTSVISNPSDYCPQFF